jgi:hypothetical protein
MVQVVSGSYYDGYGNLLPIGTSSVVITGSDVGYATTGSNTFIGNQIISGSVNATNGVTGSLKGTASYAISSSYAVKAANSDISSTTYATQIDVKNGSDAILYANTVVRISGANGTNLLVDVADWTTNNSSANTLGFVLNDIAINGFGTIITEGILPTVDTRYFSAGDLLYLSSSGRFTNIEPPAPLHGVRLGYVVRSNQNNGSIFVKVDNGYELGELHNIIDSTTASSYGDLLTKSGSIWINSKTLTGSYVLSGSLTTNNVILANSITASFYGTSSYSSNAISSSYSLSSSYAPTNFNLTASYAILSSVSSSLNFVDDVAAAAGGVPLGGLYRNGNFILIRLS